MTIAAAALLGWVSAACQPLEPLRLPVDSVALQQLFDGGSLLFTGQSNAAAEALTPAGMERADVYNEAALRTWHNDDWLHGDAGDGGDEPPGVGLLAGSLGWLLEVDHQLSVDLLGQPWPGAHIARMDPSSDNYLALRERVIASGSQPTVLLWHQGESDGIEQTSQQQYQQSLNELIEAWRLDYPSLQYMVIFLTADNACGFDQTQVRAAQRAVAAKHSDVLLVDADVLSGTDAHGDGCHYEWNGYEEQAWLALHVLSYPPDGPHPTF